MSWNGHHFGQTCAIVTTLLFDFILFSFTACRSIEHGNEQNLRERKAEKDGKVNETVNGKLELGSFLFSSGVPYT